ncbi:MAG: vitamin K epoxide reductase family protein [Daejeonella sp.]
MSAIEERIYTWLKLMGIDISFDYVKEQLLSHPDYPSTFSITDLLQKIGLEHAAIQIERESLPEAPVPFLAHVKTSTGEDFILIKDLASIEKEYPDFYEQWNGILIIAEKSEKLVLPDESIELSEKAKKNKILQYSPLILVFLLITAALFQVFSLHNSLLLGLSITGIIISIASVLQEMGISNIISNQLCGKDNNSNCNKVTQTNISILPLGIKLSDICLSFFTGMLILLLISTISYNTAFVSASHQIITLLSFASIPVTLFSIYCQGFIIKKWCTLCLIVAGILWTLATVQLTWHSSFWPLHIQYILPAILMWLLPGIFWLPVRKMLDLNKKLYDKNIQLKKFQRNSELFLAHLLQQKRVSTTPWGNDLFIGNPEAFLQLIVACNPYCAPCASVHEVLHQLIKTQDDDLGLTVRFVVSPNDKEDEYTKAVTYLLQCARSIDTAQLLHDWYKDMDMGKFKEKYHLSEYIDVDEILERHHEWINQADIQYTPTVFLNGYPIVKPYQPKDIADYLGALSEESFPPAQLSHTSQDLVT